MAVIALFGACLVYTAVVFLELGEGRILPLYDWALKAKTDVERLGCFVLIAILAFWPWFGAYHLLRRISKKVDI